MSFKYFAKYLNDMWYALCMLRKGSYRHLERIIKGFANHRRLEMLDLLKHEPELSVDQIAQRLNVGYQNASDHLRKLAIAGLVLKRSQGSAVRHKLTPKAESILMFCKKLE